MLSLPVEITFEVLREKDGMPTRRTPGLMSVGAVLYVCLNTKGVKVLLVRGYSTADFLLNLDEFAADHGQPQFIHCDRGSNLVAGCRRRGQRAEGLQLGACHVEHAGQDHVDVLPSRSPVPE